MEGVEADELGLAVAGQGLTRVKDLKDFVHFKFGLPEIKNLYYILSSIFCSE